MRCIPIPLTVALAAAFCSSLWAESWDRLLVQAASDGDSALVEECLSHGARPDQIVTEPDGEPLNALLESILGQHHEVFEALLGTQPDLAYIRRARLDLIAAASRAEDPRFLEALIAQSPNGETLLGDLIRAREYQKAEEMLDRLEPSSILESGSSLLMIEPLFLTLVRTASWHPYDEDRLTELARQVIEKGVPLPQNGRIGGAIDEAYNAGLNKFIALLDPNDEFSVEFLRNPNTPDRQLIAAVRSGMSEEADRLLEQGVRPDFSAPAIFGTAAQDLVGVSLEGHGLSQEMLEVFGKHEIPVGPSCIGSIQGIEQWELLKREALGIPDDAVALQEMLTSSFLAKPEAGEAIARELLSDHGANPNPVHEGAAHPLAAAMSPQVQWDAIGLLLDAGAKPDAKGVGGESPVEVAARNFDVPGLLRLYPGGSHPFLEKIGPRTPDSQVPGVWALEGSEGRSIALMLWPEGACLYAASAQGTLGYWEELEEGVKITLVFGPQGDQPAQTSEAIVNFEPGTKKIENLEKVGLTMGFLDWLEQRKEGQSQQGENVVETDPSRPFEAPLENYLMGPGLLELRDLMLEEVPDEVWEMEDLVYLSFANNQLQKMPQEISRLVNLQRLVLKQNRLTEIPVELGTLPLQMLSLDDNQLKELPEDFAYPPNVQTISLSNNLLESIPKAVLDQKNASSLHLGTNRITEVPESIAGFERASLLDLSNNRLTSFPSAVMAMPNLQKLNLSSNAIEQFSGSTGSLRILELAGNHLEELDVKGLQMERLNSLQLANNHIVSITGDWSGLPALTLLNLDFNKLSEIPESLYSLPQRTILSLKNNPIPAEALEDLKSKRPDLRIQF